MKIRIFTGIRIFEGSGSLTKKIRIVLMDPKMAKRTGSRILGVGYVTALGRTREGEGERTTTQSTKVMDSAKDVMPPLPTPQRERERERK